MRMLTILLVLSGAATVSAQQAPSTPQTEITDAQKAMREQVRRERAARDAIRALASEGTTLQDAVRLAGGQLTLSGRPNPDAFKAADVSELVRKSRVVLVGRPSGSPRVQLSTDRRSIVTQYSIIVDEIVRGGAGGRGMPPMMLQVKVDVPGGTMTFPEGTAEVVNDVALQPDVRYVFFLQREVDAPREFGSAPARHAYASSSDEPFVITGQHYEGLFRVDNGTGDRSLAATAVHMQARYNGKGLDSFVSEVRAVR